MYPVFSAESQRRKKFSPEHAKMMKTEYRYVIDLLHKPLEGLGGGQFLSDFENFWCVKYNGVVDKENGGGSMIRALSVFLNNPIRHLQS